MRVSIVIPVYNCAKLLGITLQSIRLCGHAEIEVLVIDGSSDDNTAEVVTSFGDLVTLFVSEPDGGQYDAINKGMARATGEILCWINGGDFFMPGAVGNAVSVFEACPAAAWITGRPCVAEGLALRRQGLHEVVVSNPEIRYGLCCGGASGFLQQEGMFWRRSLWERAGGLDLRYRLAGDYELWIRFARETCLVRLDLPLAAFSHHKTNRSIVERDAYEAEVEKVLAGFSERERRIRKSLFFISPAMRLIRRIPVVKSVIRFSLRNASSLRVVVVLWRKTRSGRFRMVISRRVCWIR